MKITCVVPFRTTRAGGANRSASRILAYQCPSASLKNRDALFASREVTSRQRSIHSRVAATGNGSWLNITILFLEASKEVRDRMSSRVPWLRALLLGLAGMTLAGHGPTRRPRTHRATLPPGLIGSSLTVTPRALRLLLTLGPTFTKLLSLSRTGNGRTAPHTSAPSATRSPPWVIVVADGARGVTAFPGCATDGSRGVACAATHGIPHGSATAPSASRTGRTTTTTGSRRGAADCRTSLARRGAVHLGYNLSPDDPSPRRRCMLAPARLRPWRFVVSYFPST